MDFGFPDSTYSHFPAAGPQVAWKASRVTEEGHPICLVKAEGRWQTHTSTRVSSGLPEEDREALSSKLTTRGPGRVAQTSVRTVTVYVTGSGQQGK